MIWRILLLLAVLGYIGMLVYRTIRFVLKEERRRPARAGGCGDAHCPEAQRAGQNPHGVLYGWQRGGIRHSLSPFRRGCTRFTPKYGAPVSV